MAAALDKGGGVGGTNRRGQSGGSQAGQSGTAVRSGCERQTVLPRPGGGRGEGKSGESHWGLIYGKGILIINKWEKAWSQ